MSSLAAATTICGQSSDAKYGGQYEWEWVHSLSQPTKSPKGTTGWAKILKSTNAAYPPGNVCRIHTCANNPCLAMRPDSKYVHVGPPLHLQAVTPISVIPGTVDPSAASSASAVAAPVSSPAASSASTVAEPVESAIGAPSDEAPSPPAKLVPNADPAMEPFPVVEPLTAMELDAQMD